MRPWLLAAAAALALLLPLSASARPCVHRCKDQRQLCKARCKAGAVGFRERRECIKACNMRHLECRARCR